MLTVNVRLLRLFQKHAIIQENESGVIRMKFGIVGGIGPASTLDYYDGLTKKFYEATGNCAPLVIDSIDMYAMTGLLSTGDNEAVVSLLLSSIENLKNAGATAAAMASNTPHIVFDELTSRSPLPLLSIVDETCKYISSNKFKRALILGTAFTMKSGLYSTALERYGITAITPNEEDIALIHSFIFPKLENGIVDPEDKAKMVAAAEGYITKEKADCVVLGCTEIPLMIKEGDLTVPTVNTAAVHIDAIAKYMLENR